MITGTFDRWRRLRHTSAPAGPGEHEVEQHQVSPVAVERRQRIGAGRADSDLEALLTHQVGKGVADRLLVLDNEHKCHATALAGSYGAKNQTSTSTQRWHPPNGVNPGDRG
jgi:hypothetical protein